MQVTGRTNIVLPMPEHFKGIRDYCIPGTLQLIYMKPGYIPGVIYHRPSIYAFARFIFTKV